MTNKEIANALREHALYDEKCHLGFVSLTYSKKARALRDDRPLSYEIPEDIRRMFLLFVAESLV